MLHRYGNIVFSVKRPRYDSHCAPRHKFPDKNHATPPCVRRFSPDVEAQIYFFEIAVQRNWKTQEACIEKQKPNDTEESLTVFEIDFRFGRNQRHDQPRIDHIIQHRQITPVGREEWLHALRCDDQRSPLKNQLQFDLPITATVFPKTRLVASRALSRARNVPWQVPSMEVAS